MNNDELAVLIPDAESGHALVVARCLAQRNVKLFAASSRRLAALRFSLRKNGFRYLGGSRCEQASALLAAHIEAIASSGADVYLPIDEWAYRFAIEHRAELSGHVRLPPMPTLEQFDVATDKESLGQFLADNAIPCPLTRSLQECLDEADGSDGLLFPLLAKPARGHGGQGICVLKDRASLEAFAREAVEKGAPRYIVQQLVRGYDIDFSALCDKGKILAFTIQKGVVARNRVFAASGGIEFLYEQELHEVASRLVQSLAFSGIAHVDFRYDADAGDFKVIEINARYWGSLTGSLMAGVNFPYLACLAALGQTFPVPTYEHKRYIDHVTFLRGLRRHLLGVAAEKFGLHETDMKFVLQDPFAELANTILRRQNA